MSAQRSIFATIYDTLKVDVCLLAMLSDETVAHGSLDYCDQPPTAHPGRVLRRFQQGWPSDFTGAIVAFGDVSPSQINPGTSPGLNAYTFRVTVRVKADDPLDARDLLAGDIQDRIILLLATRKPAVACDQPVLVGAVSLDGISLPTSFNTDLYIWENQTQIRWVVSAPSLATPAESCPC